MAVWVRVAGSVRVLVFVLVEYDLQAPAERISDAAQRLQAWNMIAAFEARDHGFCHPKSLRQLLLSLACMSAKLKQAVSALGGDCDAVIRQALSPSGRAGCALAGSAKVSDARFRRLSIDPPPISDISGCGSGDAARLLPELTTSVLWIRSRHRRRYPS